MFRLTRTQLATAGIAGLLLCTSQLAPIRPLIANECLDCGVGKAQPSAPLECQNCGISVMPLNLKRVPTERELRRAGQMGGALSPTGKADSPEFTQATDEKLKKLGIVQGLDQKVADAPDLPRAAVLLEAKEKVDRAQKITMGFGNAIQEWNEHHYAKAAGMFREHIEKYPDSPWAAEALLHLGCDSKYNGRFNEAASYYDTVLRNSEEKKGDPTWDVHQKAKLRWADLDIAEGKFSDAQHKLGNILQTENDWRRKTWARHWMVNVGEYKANARQLRACGTQALASVLVSLGRKDDAERVAKILPRNEEGFSLGEMETLSRRNGIATRGFRTSPENLSHLPLPLIIHYDFKRAAKQLSVPEPKIDAGFVTDTKLSKLRPRHKSQWPFILQPASTTTAVQSTSEEAGHFLVVRKVDAKSRTVYLFDPQEKRPYTLTYSQLERQWSGTGLVLTNREPKKLQAARQGKMVAWLSTAEMHRIIGGCCGVPRSQNWLGNGPFNIQRGPKNPCGAPTWSVNSVSMNLLVQDTPIWYQPAVGPAVAIKLSYNSQDATNQNTIFGNKWVLNYGSYLVVDTGTSGGVVTVFMPDGRQDNYKPDGFGNYVAPVGIGSTLVHGTGNHWTLTTSAGEQFIYDSPAGTGSMQPFLVQQSDRWGQSISIHYNSNVQPDQITDAQGRVTQITYSGNHVVRVDDPFGRHALFGYDVSGNLIRAVDMEGNVFGYSYDSTVRMTQIATPRGNYTFYHEGPDGSTSASNSYPAPGDPLWQNARLTLTDPLGKSEEFFYYGGAGLITNGIWGPRVWFVDKNHYQPYVSATTNNSASTVGKAQFVISQIIDGAGYAGTISGPNTATIPTYVGYDSTTGLALNTMDGRGRITNMSYNGVGAVTSITNSFGESASLGYASNGLDANAGYNSTGTKIFSIGYNAFHQPTSVVVDPDNVLGNQSGMSATYTSWGAIQSITNEQNQVTTCTYDPTTKLLTSIAKDGITFNTYTYDSIGRVRTSTNAANLTTTYSYNDLNKVTSITYDDGTFEGYEYICCGLVSKMRDRNGRVAYFDYDALKRLTRKQDFDGGVTLYFYDAEGKIVRTVNPNGRVTRALYDSLGRLARRVYHDGSYDAYGYDVHGNSTIHSDSRGHVNTVHYNEDHQIVSATHDDSSEDVSYTYNTLHQLQSRTDQSGITSYSYDLLGRVTTIDGPWTNDAITYTYDIKGRIHTRRINNTNETSYDYDDYSRLTTLVSPAGTWTFTYDGLTSLPQTITRPDGSITTYGRDSQKRLTSIGSVTSTNANIVAYAYAYDLNRNLRTALERKFGTDPIQHVDFGYSAQTDELTSELSTETPSPQINNQFAYDKMGNLTASSSTNSAGVTAATYVSNPLNQLVSRTVTPPVGSASTSALDFDFDGNLTQATSTANLSKLSYFYDSQSRLIRIEQLDSAGVKSHATTWTYDSLGRAVKTDEYTWNTTTLAWDFVSERRRIFEGLRVIQERDENNNIIANNTVSGNVGGLLARTTTAGTDYYHYDAGANVVALTDATGATVARYSYDAFGNTLTATGTHAAANPFRFASKEYNASTSLYDFGFRFYSPSLNRWLNRDPAGGINSYLYCANDPLNLVDVDGQNFRDTVAGKWNSGMNWIKDRSSDFGAGVDNVLVGWDYVWNGDPFAGPTNNPGIGGLYAITLGGAWDPNDPCHPIDWREVSKWEHRFQLFEMIPMFLSGGGEASAAERAAAGRAAETAAAEEVAFNAGHCFVAGTPVVMGDGSSKPIEQVKVGESVLARDENTKQSAPQKVDLTSIRNGITTRILTFEDGSNIETTDEHPFYVETQGFMLAKNVGVGSSIVTRAGPALKVTSNKKSGRSATVYNLTVAGTHSYFVGEQQLWVHNYELALGFEDYAKALARRTGAVHYGRVGEANPYQGIAQGDEIEDLMAEADWIHFTLKDFNMERVTNPVTGAFKDPGSQPKPFTNWEFLTIIHDRELYDKTTWYDYGDSIPELVE